VVDEVLEECKTNFSPSFSLSLRTWSFEVLWATNLNLNIFREPREQLAWCGQSVVTPLTLPKILALDEH